jgi:hypothetical protein
MGEDSCRKRILPFSADFSDASANALDAKASIHLADDGFCE